MNVKTFITYELLTSIKCRYLTAGIYKINNYSLPTGA